MGELLEKFKQALSELDAGSFSRDITENVLQPTSSYSLDAPAYDDPEEQAIVDSRIKTGGELVQRYSLMQKQQQIEALRLKKRTENAAKQNLANRSEFTRGLLRGIDTLQATYEGGLGMYNAAMGDQTAANQRFANYQEQMRQAQENPATVTDFFSTDPKTGAFASPGNFGTYVAGTLGQAVPSLTEAVASGIAGAAIGAAIVPAPDPADVVTIPAGAIGGFLGRNAMKRAIASAAQQYAQRGVAQDVAEQMADRYVRQAVANRIATNIGSGLAVSQTTALHEGGGMYAEGLEKGYSAPGTAIALGQFSGLSESLFGAAPTAVKAIIGKAAVDEVAKDFGWKTAAGYLWETIKGAGEEGVQEGFQELLGSINQEINDPNFKINSKETFMQWAEAAAAGAVTGGVVGGGGAGLQAIRDRKRQLEQIRAKGFVSESDAKQAGIDGASRRDRMANLEAERQDLDRQEQELVAQSDQEFIQQQQAGGMQVDESGQFVPQVSQADLDREFAQRMAAQGGAVATPQETDTEIVSPQPNAPSVEPAAEQQQRLTVNDTPIPKEYESLFNSDGVPLPWRFTMRFGEANGLGATGVRALQSAVLSGSPISVEQAKDLEAEEVEKKKQAFGQYKKETEEQNARDLEEQRLKPRETRTSADYQITSVDKGEFAAKVIRSSDGSVAIFADDFNVIKHSAAFAKGKTDEELMAYSFEPVGFIGARKLVDSAIPAEPAAEQPAPSLTPEQQVESDRKFAEQKAAEQAPQAVAPEDISKTVGAFGKGLTDGLYAKVWDDVQSGSLQKMSNPPLFEQLVLMGYEKGFVRSVDDVRSISNGMTGDFEADKAIGIDNLNKLAMKYQDQQPAVVPPVSEQQPAQVEAPEVPVAEQQKEPWEMSQSEARAQGWGDNWSSVVRRAVNQKKNVPAGVLDELNAYDKERESKAAIAPETPKVKVGDTVVRYTHKDGTGLLNNNGLDRSKLTDEEESELTELMDFGLQQPAAGTQGTFYFTKDGEQKHRRMLELLKKASKTGIVRTESTLEQEPSWESSDGQIAVVPKQGRKKQPGSPDAPQPTSDIVSPAAEVPASDIDAMMEDIMGQMGGLSATSQQEQPRQGRKKPKEDKRGKKSERTKAQAADKREQAKQAMLDAFKDSQGRMPSGLDIEVATKVAKAAKLYIEAGALEFKAFIENLVEDFGDAWVRDKKPYLESAWRTANKLKWVDSPAGSVDDILPASKPAMEKVKAPGEKQAQAEKESGVDKTLRQAGLKVERLANGTWQITGNTYEHSKEIGDVKREIRELGGFWDKYGKRWTFKADPRRAIADRLVSKGVGAESSDAGVSDEQMARERARREEDAKADVQTTRDAYVASVDQSTRDLVGRGLKFGMTDEVVNNQIEDIGRVVVAAESGLPMFVIGSAPGTGKTFVLGGVIRELRRRGFKKFVYVTQNEDLVSQVQKNLADYGLEGVEFVTYAKARTSPPSTTGSVLLLDEAHTAKNLGRDTGKKLASMVQSSDFTVYATATPFENVTEAEYIGYSGIFDDLKVQFDRPSSKPGGRPFRNELYGFKAWAWMFGANVYFVKQEDRSGEARYVPIVWWDKQQTSEEDQLAANEWLKKRGVYVQRPMALPLGVVNSELRSIEADPYWADISNKVVQIYADAESEAENNVESGQIKAHKANVLKRLLEASKVDAAIARAKDLIGEGKKDDPQVIIFVNTKADTDIGTYTLSEPYRKEYGIKGKEAKRRYTPSEMDEMMQRWYQAKAIAKQMGDDAGPPPFAPFVHKIAMAMDAAGVMEKFPSVIDKIMDAFPGQAVEYSGRTASQNTSNLAKWKNNEAKLIVATMDKGGTGLSFHDTTGTMPSRYQVNMNLPWSGTKVEQVSGRLARYGTAKPVNIEWIFANNIPFDRELSKTVGSRMRSMAAAVQGRKSGEAKQIREFDFEESQVSPDVAPASPWFNATVEDEGRWAGTSVNVSAKGKEESYAGKVVRVLNKGETIEVQRDGFDAAVRVPAERVSVVDLVDSKPVSDQQSDKAAKILADMESNQEKMRQEKKQREGEKLTNWVKAFEGSPREVAAAKDLFRKDFEKARENGVSDDRLIEIVEHGQANEMFTEQEAADLKSRIKPAVQQDPALQMHYPDGSAYQQWMSRRHEIGDSPTSYLSGHSSAKVREAAKQNPGLGLVITPANPSYVGHAGDYSHIMIDNGAFSEFTGKSAFSEEKFFALLDSVVAAGLKDKVQFVVVPDRVGSWKGTNERWEEFSERVRAYGMPLAYVGQDGIEQNIDEIPWDEFDVFFIGGSTPWKLGYDPNGDYKDINRPTDSELSKAGMLREHADLIKEAKRRGKKIHMGRVNSWKRMEMANYGMQVDSVDGNYIGAAPDKNLPVVLDWLMETGGDRFLARHELLLNRAAPYVEKGESYKRDIADPAMRLQLAIAKGNPIDSSLVQTLADELEVRLDYWEPILQKAKESERVINETWGDERTLDKAVERKYQADRLPIVGKAMQEEKVWYQTQDKSLNDKIQAWLDGGELPTRVYGDSSGMPMDLGSGVAARKRAQSLANKLGVGVAIVQHTKTFKAFLVELPVSRVDGQIYGSQVPLDFDENYELIGAVAPDAGKEKRTSLDKINDELLGITKEKVKNDLIAKAAEDLDLEVQPKQPEVKNEARDQKEEQTDSGSKEGDGRTPKDQGGKGRIVGAKTKVGKRKAHYEVIEIDQLIGSHYPFGMAVNDQFPEEWQKYQRRYESLSDEQKREVWMPKDGFDPSQVIDTTRWHDRGPTMVVEKDGKLYVVGGTRRYMMLANLYRSFEDKAMDYHNALVAEAEMFGLDVAAVNGMDKPILIRVIDEPGNDIPKLVDELNADAAFQKDPAAEAASLGRGVGKNTIAILRGIGDEETLAKFLDRKGVDVVYAMVSDNPELKTKVPNWVKGNSLTKDAKLAVQKAIMGAVISDATLINQASPRILQSVNGALAEILLLNQKGGEWSLSDRIKEAITYDAEFRVKGKAATDQNIRYWMNDPQMTFLEEFKKDPNSDGYRLWRYLLEFGGARKFRNALQNTMLREARLDDTSGGLFADIEESMTGNQAFDLLLGDTGNAENQLDASLRNPPETYYQTEPDIDATIRSKALDLGIAANKQGITQFEDFIAYAVDKIGEAQTRRLGNYLTMVGQSVGMKGVRPTKDVLGVPMTQEQYVQLSRETFASVPAEQVEAGIEAAMLTGLPQMAVGFAPAGSPVPGQGFMQEEGVSRINMNYKDVTKRIPQLTEASQKLLDGEITKEEYAALVDRFKPVAPYESIPSPATVADAQRALPKFKFEKFGNSSEEIPAGYTVELRLDINAYKEHDVWINSIHRKVGKKEVTQYDSYAYVTDVDFVQTQGEQGQALDVARGARAKGPFARIKGKWSPTTKEQAVEMAEIALRSAEWTQVGYDPERHSYFYDRFNHRLVLESADEVIQIGPLVLAKNPVYASQGDVLFQSQESAPRWYLKSRKLIADKMGSKATSEQVVGMLRKNGVAEDELYWSGLEELLGSKESVTKSEVLAAIDNGFRVQEVQYPFEPPAATEARRRLEEVGITLQKGMDGEFEWENEDGVMDEGDIDELPDEQQADIEIVMNSGMETRDAKYAEFTTPGGENYREILITLPIAKKRAYVGDAKYQVQKNIYGDGKFYVVRNGVWDDKGFDTTEEAQAVIDAVPTAEVTDFSRIYKSGHWSEYNVLAHVRMNERVDANGNKVLLLEEVQSDWHQEGRKKGYAGKTFTPVNTKSRFPGPSFSTEKEARQWVSSLPSQMQKQIVIESKEKPGIPDAPFKKTWPMLVMKRAIQYAAENGFDKVAWVTGETQAKRYGLEGVINQIEYSGTDLVVSYKGDLGVVRHAMIVPDMLPAYIGEEAAKKLMAKEPENGTRSLQDLELKVGGEGMKSFYDQILPNETSKLIKKFGGKVSVGNIQPARNKTGDPLVDILDSVEDRQVYQFSITPAMRESALQYGQSLFQQQYQGGNVKGWTKFISGTRALIGATSKADISTVIHEFAHPIRRFLLDKSVPQNKRFDITNEEIDMLADKCGVKNGNWDVEAEEKFARMWEQYWFEGKSPNSVLDSLFAKISRWMQQVYSSITAITGQPLDPEVRKLFDKLVQRGLTPDQRAAGKKSGGGTAAPVTTSDDPWKQRLTSIANQVVELIRLRLGVPGLTEPSAETFKQWLDEAKQILSNDPTYAERLVKELAQSNRNVDNIDVAVLQIHFRHLNNQLEAASDRLFKAKEENDSVAAAKARLDTDLLVNQIEEFTDITKRAGTEAGRALVARKIALQSDFTLGSLLRKARIANAGEELSEDQIDEITELSKKIAELEGQLEKETQKNNDLERRLAAEQSIEDTKKEVGKPVRNTATNRASNGAKKFVGLFASIFGKKTDTGTLQQTEDEKMAEAAVELIQGYVDAGVYTFGDFMARFKRDIGMDVPMSARVAIRKAWDDMKSQGGIPAPEMQEKDSPELRRLARTIQRSVVEAGIVEPDEVIDAVHESLQEVVEDITKRETMDAMSGYGQFYPASKDPNDKIIRDLNSQYQQMAKLDDMRQGMAPKRTGSERPEPSPEVRDLIRQVNEMKRNSKYFVTDEETQLKTIFQATRTALKNRIYDLDKAIREKEPIPGRTPTIFEGEQAKEIESLRKQRDELMATYKATFPKPGLTFEQRAAIAERAADRAIAELEKQLVSGDVSPKGRPEPISTPSLEAKRNRLVALRAERDAVREMQNPKMTKEERDEKAYVANLLSRIADYEDRMQRGYFGPRPKKPPRELSPREKELSKQLENIKDEFFRYAAEYRLKNMTPVQKAWDYTKETMHLSRAIMTSFDLSAVFRQGGIASFAHPKLAASSAKEMYYALRDGQEEFNTMDKISKDDLYAIAMQAGLSITTDSGKITRQEEAYMGRWAKWGIGKKGTKINKLTRGALIPVSASARAYTTFLNSMRFRLFKHMVSNLGAGGQVTLDEAKVIASYVNAATGRAELGKFNQAAANLNMVFFAPRYVASRFQYLAMPFYLLPSSKVSGRVKKMIAMEYARFAIGVTSMLGLSVLLGSMLTDDEEEKPTVEFDPRSSDFMKLKIGETRIDPMAGLSQTVTLIGQLATGQKKGLKGDIQDLYGEKRKFGDPDLWDVTTGFLRKKLAPIPGAIVDLRVGENVIGEKETPFTTGLDLFVPLSFQEAGETFQARGLVGGAGVVALSLLGMGGGTYGPRTAYATGDSKKREELFKKDLERVKWDSPDPAYKDFLTTEQVDKFNKQREGRKQALVYAASADPKRKEYVSDESFKQSVAERDKALDAVIKAGMGYEEIKQLLIAYYKRNYGSAYETRGGNYQMKESLTNRLRAIRRKMNEKQPAKT